MLERKLVTVNAMKENQWAHHSSQEVRKWIKLKEEKGN